MDIIVTTPKKDLENAQAETDSGEPYWFRRLPHKPVHLNIGDRVFYLSDGCIIGFARLLNIEEKPNGMQCSTTGKIWPPGWYLIIDAYSWTDIQPIPCRGFQGFKYFKASDES